MILINKQIIVKQRIYKVFKFSYLCYSIVMSMRAFVLNCPVDLCNIDEALLRSKEAIENNSCFHIVTISRVLSFHRILNTFPKMLLNVVMD